MNYRQRNKNRKTARLLKAAITPCPRCGLKGPHWVAHPLVLYGIRELDGFWTCPDLYGPDGRRK